MKESCKTGLQHVRILYLYAIYLTELDLKNKNNLSFISRLSFLNIISYKGKKNTDIKAIWMVDGTEAFKSTTPDFLGS